MDFAHVIYPCTVSDFFRNYFEKSFYFSPRNDADHYRDLISEGDLDLYFSQQDLSPKGIRVVKNGVLIPKEQWTTSSKSALDFLVVQPGKLLNYFHEGFTLVLSGAQNKFPGLASACSAFEQETRIQIQANIYITPPRSQGFSLHYDHHDIFTLQVKGVKHWKLYDSGEALSTSRKPFTRTPVLIQELDLKAGDLLYMPRGLVHEAYTTDVSTIHVNFSCIPSYGFNVLAGLAGLAEDSDVFFRKMLPNALTSEEDVRNYTEEFTAKLRSLISDQTVGDLIKDYQARLTKVQIIDRRGMFSDSMALESLKTHSVVQRRANIAYSLEKKKNVTIVSFNKESITVSVIFDIEIFLQELAFTVSDIKGLLTDHGRIVLVSEFVKAGFLEIRKI
jgi:hypothetical protein